MKKLISILLFPLSIFSQEVFIDQLSLDINTYNAELNFVRINDTAAYFTFVTEKDGKLESDIYAAYFTDDKWRKKQCKKYNSDHFNTANISFFEGGRTFLSRCNKLMKDCKIFYLEKDSKNTFTEIPSLSLDQFINTQAFVARHDFQKVLYFVSDRKGGFGGLDIWLSIIDIDGNFGFPINAGNNINSTSDEITPFYNQYDGMMYFSSNKSGGIGGFDIYKAKGSLNLWSVAKNKIELNTINDELYLTFYDKYTGYFSSNRKESELNSTEYCCNDIFSFKYSKTILDTFEGLSKIRENLPLKLYFHNDEPDCCTMNITTEKTYKDSYISYFMMQSAYEQENPNINNFFEDVLQQNFNTLNAVIDILLLSLKYGNTFEIQIRGYASPLHNSDYNNKLSQRRLYSFINYLHQFKQGVLLEYMHSKKLLINELYFGESTSPKKVSDNPNEKQKSIYSIEAMLQRKIEIIDITLVE